jgi:hypothetical protein
VRGALASRPLTKSHNAYETWPLVGTHAGDASMKACSTKEGAKGKCAPLNYQKEKRSLCTRGGDEPMSLNITRKKPPPIGCGLC